MESNKPYPAQRAVLRDGQWVTEIAPQDDGAERVRQARAALRACLSGDDDRAGQVDAIQGAVMRAAERFGIDKAAAALCDCGVEGCEGRPKPVKAPLVLKVGRKYRCQSGEVSVVLDLGSEHFLCSDSFVRNLNGVAGFLSAAQIQMYSAIEELS